jgi:hypothetical protein
LVKPYHPRELLERIAHQLARPWRREVENRSLAVSAPIWPVDSLQSRPPSARTLVKLPRLH